MEDLAQHWWRLGQLSLGEALRESGLSDERATYFSDNLRELESRREVREKHLDDFVSRFRAHEDSSLPLSLLASEEPQARELEPELLSVSSRWARRLVGNYWKCFVLAVIGRGDRDSSLESLLLVKDPGELGLNEDEALALCVNLSSNPRVRSLQARDQSAFASHLVCETLSRSLRTNSVLESLSLASVGLGCDAVQMITEGVEINHNLRALDLGTNPEIRSEGMRHIVRLLTVNSSLERLDVQDVGCGVESAKLMASVLGSNFTLQSLSIGNNAVSAEGSRRLLEVLTPRETYGASWSTLASLLTGGEAAESKNSSLKHLGLQNTQAEDVAVVSLAAMLRASKSLLWVDLSGVLLDHKDWIDHIFPALKVNDALQRLHLDNCGDLPAGSLMELITSTATKTALEEISLHGTSMASKAGAIHEELMVNKRFRKKWRDRIRVKPKSARIVLCGFEFAGKSTICKTMTDVVHGSSWEDSWKATLKRVVRRVPCLREILFGGHAVRELEDRTRGCEIVHLKKFEREGNVSVWDFAGLKEYYALQDYLFPGFRNSCFLYVCSVRFPPYVDPEDARPSGHGPGAIKGRGDIRQEFLYWLQFIASNSKPIPPADGQCGILPRVILVLTNKDSLDSPQLNSSRRWARDVLGEMQERFKERVDIQDEVQVVDAHSRADVERLFDVAEDSIEQLLELSTEYAISEQVRLELERWSARKSKPVLNMTEFRDLCVKRLEPKMDPVEYQAAKLGDPEGQMDILRYLDYTGEIIYTSVLDLIVVNPRWFGMGVLGSLIDAFRGKQVPDDWRGVIGTLENCLKPSDLGPKYQHTEGFVTEEDFKEITRHLERYMSLDSLIELMIQLELCFKIEVEMHEETMDSSSDTLGSEAMLLRTPLLGRRSLRKKGDAKLHQNYLFIPAIFDEASRNVKPLDWSSACDDSGQQHQYLGRRLECENNLTFLTPGFFPRLQVSLLNYLRTKGWANNRAFQMGQHLIRFFEDGKEILVEYSGAGDYFIDILVKTSQPFGDTIQFIEEHLVNRIRQFCATPRGCPGVTLVEAVIRPVCVKYLFSVDERRNQAEFVSHFKERMKENGRGYQYEWRVEIEGVNDFDSALDLLHGEGSLSKIMKRHILFLLNQTMSSARPGWIKGMDMEDEAVTFPGLFYPTLDSAATLFKIMANIETKVPIRIHLLCEDRHGVHVVEGQTGRILEVQATSNSPLLKYALCLVWFGVIRGSEEAGLSMDFLDEDWVERLYRASDLSPCIEDLFRIMDPSQPLKAATTEDILEAYPRYLQIEPSTDWLLDFLFLDNRRDFWQDFQLRRVRNGDAIQSIWVCDRHYRPKRGKHTYESMAA